MRAIACVIVLCMHASSLNSKLLMTTRKKYFPCFIATQIDQSSPPVVRNASSTDRGKHRKFFELLSKLKPRGRTILLSRKGLIKSWIIEESGLFYYP